MKDARIKLAEAMDIHPLEFTNGKLWDPFTDANDDYAVLEWMRDGDSPATRYQKFKDEFASNFADYHVRWYLYEV